MAGRGRAIGMPARGRTWGWGQAGLREASGAQPSPAVRRSGPAPQAQGARARRSALGGVLGKVCTLWAAHCGACRAQQRNGMAWQVRRRRFAWTRAARKAEQRNQGDITQECLSPCGGAGRGGGVEHSHEVHYAMGMVAPCSRLSSKLPQLLGMGSLRIHYSAVVMRIGKILNNRSVHITKINYSFNLHLSSVSLIALSF